MIVVDANILAFYVIKGKRTVDANALRDKDAEWILPAFWCVEFQSILWKYVRFDGMAASKALELLDQAMAMFAPNGVTPRPDMVLRDALAWKITAYDAQYVSLANHLGVRCVTEDGPVQKACPTVAISLDNFLGRATAGGMVHETGPSYRTRTKHKRL